ncbi:hypothetical protein [Methylobacterium durans]|uniref:hypothetical protein n=1 Tax=Methylobacterium durans TaxID=2202825 RepID=UPI0013A54B77|nr:hypothetical protein [Methylobacterium durans]
MLTPEQDGLLAQAYILCLRDKADFEKTKNPFFVFSAIKKCHTFGVVPPEWALDFIGKATVSMFEGELSLPASKSSRREVERISKYFGFGVGRGRTGRFAEGFQLLQDRLMDELAETEKKKVGTKKFRAKVVPSKLGVSRQTFDRAVKRSKT